MTERDRVPDIPVQALTRRRFLGLVGSGAAMASLTACRAAPAEGLVPYVQRPPEVTPGKSQMYATSFLRGGYAVGLLGETRQGRPIKIEGNPVHPASLGASGVWEQASVLSLYDPDRAQQMRKGGKPTSWAAFCRAFGPRSGRSFTRNEGEGLHLWLEPTSSPIVGHLLARLRERYPRMNVWFDPSYAPVSRLEGATLAFGQPLESLYDFERAERIVALDSDFLTDQPMSLRWAKQFARRRRIETPHESMNRLYAIDPALNVTGITADHRLPVRAGDILSAALGLVGALHELTDLPPPLDEHAKSWLDRAPHPRVLRTLAKDLWRHRKTSVVVVGDRQPAVVHAAGHLLNDLLGAAGRTVRYVPSPILEAGQPAFHPEGLFAALDANAVDTLMTVEANPAYTAPAAWRFRERLRKAGVHVHAAAYEDETAQDASWFLPTRHPYESWGLVRAQDGALTPVQPLIKPLFGGLQVENLLAALDGVTNVDPKQLAQETATQRSGESLEQLLARGWSQASVYASEQVRPDPHAFLDGIPDCSHEQQDWELIVQPDPRILDGRHANNAWLQELPEPVTKLVWDNAALISPATARELGVSQGDVVEIQHESNTVRLPVWPQPGMTDRTVLVWLGYGRRNGGSIGHEVGVDVSSIRPGSAPFVRGARIVPTGEHRELVSTQHHEHLEGRPIILRRSLTEFHEDPEFAQPYDVAPPSIYPDRTPDDVPQWGMAIDLNACTGCSACVIACQAENNVPAVGKKQVAMGREMHWLRIDRYYTGAPGNEGVDVQPMLCQHCEQAPCEYVCPVYATTHSPDGINEMTYNRCVGTRFCSNNCPYKVRRFNWYDFHEDVSETRKMQMNPDVTVRARGVMEKCTYCVQRIRRAEIEAKRKGQPMRETDVVTACQQACPTEAIVFGQVSDPDSQVSNMFRNKRTYAVLNDAGTRPRTRYLARILNRNEDMPQ